MKILCTSFNSLIVARHAVVVCPSTMPRQMRYNSQMLRRLLLPQVIRTILTWRLATRLELKVPREQQIGVASQASRGSRCRQGIGFASAIETVKLRSTFKGM